ncbi:hypothetical protein LTR64_002942 [Lithohypha guttulata]|uniref:uncharacterized protein n=1 Tax=Lithohypha guttulata TaxID=1690604 RepID=UPI002DDE6AF1|nr:hypothetical protein LTR51_000833 [Lithohypha guttulata]
MDQQRFLQQLQIVLDPKKGNVKTATKVLQDEYYKRPEALLFLMQIIISHDSPDLKQLAATQARPLVAKMWTKIPDEQRKSARSQLFQATMTEKHSLTRHSSSRLVSAIAKVDLEDGEWAELPNMLQQAATSSNADERAVGVYLLYSLLETMGENFSDRFQALFELFSTTIEDPESLDVRVNTLLAISKMAMVIDAEEDQAPVKAFQNLFPAMVKVLQDTISNGKDEQIMLSFEVFNTLLTTEYQLLQKHFHDLVELMNQIGTDKQFSDETRTQAISFLIQCVVYRRLRVQGMKMGEPLTKSMLAVVAEIEDINDDDDVTPGRSALGLIDTMAQNLPAQQVIAPLVDLLPKYAANSDPAYRRAAIMALGYSVEGAPDFISTQLARVFPVLYQLLEDQDVSVRQAALQTTARLADDLPTDVTKEHEKLMPLLAKNLTAAMQQFKGEEEGPAIDIMRSSVSAVDSVVDGMESHDAVQYLDKLAPLLQRLIQHPDFKIKGLAAGALGSLASTVEEPFKPYLSESMQAMQGYITKKESEDELDLRASCTDAMGEMAVAVGPADFKDYVQPLMQASEEALKLEHSRLKESTYILWGSLAKVYEEDFAPFLGGVVNGLFECIDQEEESMEVQLGDEAKDLVGQEVTIAGRKIKVADALDDDDDDDDDIEDIDLDDDDSDWNDLTTVTPLALEKEIAIEVIGDVVGNTKAAYIPYFEKTIQKLLPLVDHSYENIRKAAFSTLHRAYAALYEVQEESGAQEKWQAGLPLKVQPVPELEKLGDLVMTATLTTWADEEDTAVVSTIAQSLAENLKMTGPFLIANQDHLRQVVQVVGTLITKKHTCQADLAEEEPDLEDMDSTELEWLVIDSAMDVISGLAAALGPNFNELWKIFEKPVLRYASGAESLGRASACGVISEIIVGMGEAITPMTSQLMTILLKRMSDEDDQTKSNAAYAAGRLVEKSSDTATISKSYGTILSKLENLLTISNARCKDNAAGCVSRLILKNKSAVPLSDVLPALVNILPLKDDFQENEPVWKMIITLYREQDSNVQKLTPKLAPIMLSVLGEPTEQLTDEVRIELNQLVDHLRSQG